MENKTFKFIDCSKMDRAAAIEEFICYSHWNNGKPLKPYQVAEVEKYGAYLDTLGKAVFTLDDYIAYIHRGMGGNGGADIYHVNHSGDEDRQRGAVGMVLDFDIA